MEKFERHRVLSVLDLEEVPDSGLYGTAERNRGSHPQITPVHYAWPFDLKLVANMLATQVKQFSERSGEQGSLLTIVDIS